MEVRCRVHVDGDLTEEICLFSVVPRVGETVQIRSRWDEPKACTVCRVEHIAKGVLFPDEAAVILHVTSGTK